MRIYGVLGAHTVVAYSETGHFLERTGPAASSAQNDFVCMYR